MWAEQIGWTGNGFAFSQSSRWQQKNRQNKGQEQPYKELFQPDGFQLFQLVPDVFTGRNYL